jgi:PucR family transcriptional regulator, purine catabolism regulatory protein
MPAEAPIPTGLDLHALGAITDAVESGAGLPEVVRAAARALDASLILTDRGGGTLAVAAQSPADEASLSRDGADVETIELRVADEPVGLLRMRLHADADPPAAAMVRLVTTLVASEVERVRAPERASGEAAAAFLRALSSGELADRDEALTRAEALGLDLSGGASMVALRAHALVPVDDGWRERVLGIALRGARGTCPMAIAAAVAPADAPGGEVVVLVPGGDGAAARRTTEAILHELGASLGGHAFAVGLSRVADAGELARAGAEARLACNVAEGDVQRPLLSFDETGAYRLLLSAMSENPAELQRFYAETVEPLVAYDEQYETDLVQTLEAFLDNDGNVAGTAQRLFTHRHTIRYRLERVRELSGLDVGSSDGREKLSLGLKAMRVLGIVARRGPAGEEGAGAGRVPRR